MLLPGAQQQLTLLSMPDVNPTPNSLTHFGKSGEISVTMFSCTCGYRPSTFKNPDKAGMCEKHLWPNTILKPFSDICDQRANVCEATEADAWDWVYLCFSIATIHLVPAHSIRY